MPKDCYSGANFFETADEACSNDSSLVRRAMDRCGGGWNEEVTSQMSSKGGGSGIVRGQSKEFLQVEVRAAGAFAVGYAPVPGHKIQLTPYHSRRYGFSSVARRQ